MKSKAIKSKITNALQAGIDWLNPEPSLANYPAQAKLRQYESMTADEEVKALKKKREALMLLECFANVNGYSFVETVMKTKIFGPSRVNHNWERLLHANGINTNQTLDEAMQLAEQIKNNEATEAAVEVDISVPITGQLVLTSPFLGQLLRFNADLSHSFDLVVKQFDDAIVALKTRYGNRIKRVEKLLRMDHYNHNFIELDDLAARIDEDGTVHFTVKIFFTLENKATLEESTDQRGQAELFAPSTGASK